MNSEQAAPLIAALIDPFVEGYFEVLVASACTEDGFVIAHRNGKSSSLEEDKVAALSSSLLSMAEAATKVINSGGLKVTIIDAERAHLVLVKTQCRDLPVVLAVAAESSLSVGQVLHMANKLASGVAAI